jgi:hypothetical protein
MTRRSLTTAVAHVSEGTMAAELALGRWIVEIQVAVGTKLAVPARVRWSVAVQVEVGVQDELRL